MTPVQAKLYAYLVERIDEPVAPSFDEMRIFLGVASKSSVMRVVRVLEAQDRIYRVPGGSRTIRARRPNPCDGVPSSVLLAELKRRGDIPDAR